MFGCSGVQVFRVLGFWCLGVKVFGVFKISDISEDQKGGRPKNGQNFGWGKNSRFWASSSAKEVLQTTENMRSTQN